MRYLIAVCCALAVIVAQALYGGAMRPVFALPALLVVGIAGLLALVAAVWRNVPAPSVSCLASVGAFAGWLLWRGAQSPDPWLVGVYFRLTLGCLVLYLIFACALTNPYHRLAFLSMLLVAAVAQSATAAWQFARPETGPLVPWLSEQLRIWYAPRWNFRGHGTYLNGNHLVWFLNVAALMALSFTCWGRWGLKTKIICLYAALSSVAGILVTLSRGGLLGFGAGLAAFLALSALTLAIGARDRRVVATLLVLAVVVIIASGGFLVFKSSLIVQNRIGELVNDDYRPLVFEAVWRQAQLLPLEGTGSGTFLYYGRQYREMTDFTDDVYAHNDWAQLFADFGFPAIFLLALVVWAHFSGGLVGLSKILRQRMLQHSLPQSHAAAIMIGAMASLAVFVVHSFFDFNMQIPANALLAAAILGMLANPGTQSPSGRSWISGIWRKAGCVIGAGAGAWLMVLTFRATIPEAFWLLAENAFLEGRLADARSACISGLASQPHGRLESLLGEIYLDAARRQRDSLERVKLSRLAVVHLERSLAISPNDASCYLQLAEAQAALGKREAALSSSIAAIGLIPLRGRGYEVYGQLLEDQGRLSEALQAYRVAASIPGNLLGYQRAQELQKKLFILSQ